MKQLLLFVIGIAMTSLAFSQTASPELVSSAGDSFNNSTYQLSWSIGESVTATHSAESYVITQGLHQNRYTVTALEDLRADIEMSVYPNPTTNFITLDFQTTVEIGNVIITDINGKVLQQKEITSEVEQLDFSNYASGVYFLSVIQENKLIKSFKIIKN